MGTFHTDLYPVSWKPFHRKPTCLLGSPTNNALASFTEAYPWTSTCCQHPSCGFEMRETCQISNSKSMDEAIYAPKKLAEWLVKFAFCVHCSAYGVDGKIQRMSKANPSAIASVASQTLETKQHASPCESDHLNDQKFRNIINIVWV